MTNPPTLAIPYPKWKMWLETDASRYAIGGVLSQQQEDNSWRPIAYLSKAMNETERNYKIYDQELLAVMEGLKQWRQYLIGSDQFEIWTDHKNLGYFKKPQKLNCRQAWWMTELQEYNFQLVHKQRMVQEHYDSGRRILERDRWGAVERSEEGWRREGKVILWKERIYIPDSVTLHEEIINRHHDSELAGHPGYTKTHKLITRNYWWPRILEDIKQYIAGYERCQATKPNQQPKRNNLHPNKIPRGPWKIISIDLVGPLPELSGYDRILVIVDCFSKMAHYIPINMNITAQGVAKVLWDWVFKDIEIPQKVISGQGPQFMSRFIKELCCRLRVKRNPSTAYHPQTDRQTEQVNQELKQYLRLYCNYQQND